MRFGKIFSLKFSLLMVLSLFCLVSCSKSETGEINKVFEQKYGKEVARIRAERAPENDLQGAMTSSVPIQSDDDDHHPGYGYYAYVDVAKFGEKIPQAYLPNGESYEQERSKNPSNSLPSNMFEVSYNTTLYPPFHRVGAEFDGIKIPAADVYGVKTEMSEKSYLLAGNDSLQKNIDYTIAAKTDDDIEISEILIREQKQLKRKQKMLKIFGQDSVEMASLEEISNSENESGKKSKAKSAKAESKNNQKLAGGQSAPQSGFISKVIKN